MSGDAINPDHYKQGSIECIDAIRSALGPAFPDYCIGYVLGLLWGWKTKSGTEDLEEAAVYLLKAIEAASARRVEQPAANALESPAGSPSNPQYRDVTEADVGRRVEVQDHPFDPWQAYTLIGFIHPASKIGEAGYRFETDGCLNWKYARVKVGGEA